MTIWQIYVQGESVPPRVGVGLNGSIPCVTSVSKEGKLEPADNCQELQGQSHDLEGKTEFPVDYTKLKRKNNIS